MEEVIELIGFYAAYTFVLSLLSIVVYVLQSLGLYTIAQRRGIDNAWLAWLPIGSLWIMGAIADDYQLKVNGQVKNRRKLLLWLSVGMLVALPLYIGLLAAGMLEPDALLGILVFVILLMLAVMTVAVIASVFTYICLYDLYASCDPNNKVLYLILSIVISNITAVFIFVCRNKDLGMVPPAPRSYYQPPQQLPPQYQPPQYQPPQYQPPQYQPPQYQPPQYQPPQQPPYNGQ